MLLSVGKQSKELLTSLGKCAAVLIIVEVLLIVVEFAVLLNGGAEEVHTAKALLAGDWSFLFFAVEIFLGALIPVVALLAIRGNAAAQAVASMLILVGIFTMRYIIVIGGQVIGQ